MSSKKVGIDFEKSLGAVTRTVSELTKKDGKPVRNITLERSYSTTSDDLWDAVTNPERLERFFAPVNGELELDGQYQIVKVMQMARLLNVFHHSFSLRHGNLGAK